MYFAQQATSGSGPLSAAAAPDWVDCLSGTENRTYGQKIFESNKNIYK